jgi:hypothetical protein
MVLLCGNANYSAACWKFWTCIHTLFLRYDLKYKIIGLLSVMGEDSGCSLHIFSSRSQVFFNGFSQSVVFLDYSFLTFQVTTFIFSYEISAVFVWRNEFPSQFQFFFHFSFYCVVTVLRSPEGPAFIPRPKRVLILGHFVLYFSLFRLLLAIRICVYIYTHI